MSLLATTAPSTRTRTTAKLTGSVAKVAAHLDQRSLFAIDYARVYLKAASGKAVPVSGIIRRALAVYMDRLSQEVDPSHEFRVVEQTCAGRTLPGYDRHQIETQIRAAAAQADQGIGPAPFRVVCAAPWAVDVQAVDEKVDALLSAHYRNQFKARG